MCLLRGGRRSTTVPMNECSFFGAALETPTTNVVLVWLLRAEHAVTAKRAVPAFHLSARIHSGQFTIDVSEV